MHNNTGWQGHNLRAWVALQEIAERNDLERQRIRGMLIGQHVAGVMVYSGDHDAVFAGRCGWYEDDDRRAITDVRCYIWHEHAGEATQCVQEHNAILVPAAKVAYRCDTPRQAHALAALASEDGNLPEIERMIRHEQ